MNESGKAIFCIQGVSKHFGGTKALKDISFDIREGEIHAIVGENGAGKSTLMNILSGALVQDAGEVYYNGEPVVQATPRKMQDLGVAMVYQELNLLPHRDVVRNAYLGRELKKNLFFVDYETMRKNTAEQLRLLGVEKFPEGPVKSLPVAALQLIEIAKALLRQSRVVIMDEPNSALSEQESRKLFDIIRSLKARGISIIYISHRLEEVLGLVDRITVLRDGCYIGTYEAAATSLQEIIDLMLGRKLENMFPTREHVSAPAAEPLLKLDRVSKEKKLHEVSLDLHEKEIVGIFGLEGSGRQEIAEILYGLLQPDSGGIAISGRKTILGSPIAAKARGIAYVPADRKWEGLVLGQDIRTNISLSILAKVCRFGILRNGFLSALVKRYIHKLNLKCSSMYQKAVDLSGGNQQKVVLSKALATEPRIIVLNEPTRGIDIGAKREIYDQIFELARDGLGVLFISSELPEIMALSDRIFVICGGTIRAEVKSEEVTENQVLALACGA